MCWMFCLAGSSMDSTLCITLIDASKPGWVSCLQKLDADCPSFEDKCMFDRHKHTVFLSSINSSLVLHQARRKCLNLKNLYLQAAFRNKQEKREKKKQRRRRSREFWVFPGNIHWGNSWLILNIKTRCFFPLVGKYRSALSWSVSQIWEAELAAWKWRRNLNEGGKN